MVFLISFLFYFPTAKAPSNDTMHYSLDTILSGQYGNQIDSINGSEYEADCENLGGGCANAVSTY